MIYFEMSRINSIKIEIFHKLLKNTVIPFFGKK